MSKPWFPQHSPDEYRDHGTGPSQPGYAQPLGEPRPGHGTVYLAQNRDGTWSGSWQDNYPARDANGAVAGIEDVDDLTEQDVIDWATTRPASQVYVLVTTDTGVGSVRQTAAIPLRTWLSQHPLHGSCPHRRQPTAEAVSGPGGSPDSQSRLTPATGSQEHRMRQSYQ